MIDAALANLVRDRAGDRCEYCLMRQQDDPFFRFHIEHIIPRQHGGRDESANLALACHHCNLHKGPNLAGIDPETDAITPLFHPRRQIWVEHFEIRGIRIAGKTPVGRATIDPKCSPLTPNVPRRICRQSARHKVVGRSEFPP